MDSIEPSACLGKANMSQQELFDKSAVAFAVTPSSVNDVHSDSIGTQVVSTTRKRVASASGHIKDAMMKLPFGRFLRSKNGTKMQAASPLFKLPYELREMIWEYALTPTEGSISPHFHIYDIVIDSCTYHTYGKEQQQRRKRTSQISLLLTCRAIHHEALQFLWEKTEFTLVLLAGRARPGADLKKRNSLGTVKDCEALFSRMRKVTLIVQPGQQPHVEKYTTRVEELLAVTNNFQGATSFCLHFNFHYHVLYPEGGDERFSSILKAFYPLCDRTAPLLIQACSLWALTDDPATKFRELQAALPNSTLHEWYHLDRRGKCIKRGYTGQVDNTPSRSLMSRREKAFDNAIIATTALVYLAAFPISMPATYLAYRKRKYDKGEW